MWTGSNVGIASRPSRASVPSPSCTTFAARSGHAFPVRYWLFPASQTFMDRRLLALAALFFVNLLYGINYVVAKGLMPDVIGPSGFILLRVAGANLLFWPVWLIKRERVAWSDAGRLVLCGISGVA